MLKKSARVEVFFTCALLSVEVKANCGVCMCVRERDSNINRMSLSTPRFYRACHMMISCLKYKVMTGGNILCQLHDQRVQ